MPQSRGVANQDVREGMGTSEVTQPLSGSQRTFLVLLLAAVLANLSQFDPLPAGGRFRPVPHFNTPDITKVAEKDSQSLRNRYSLFFDLGRRYPGSTIILRSSAKHAQLWARRFLSYGRARSVALTDFEPISILSKVEYESFTVARGKIAPKGARGEETIPFVVAAGPNPEIFLFLDQQRGVVLLDLRLILAVQATSHD